MQSLTELCDKCEVPTLDSYGIDKQEFFDQIDKMVHDAIARGSSANTIHDISEQNIKELYQSLW